MGLAAPRHVSGSLVGSTSDGLDSDLGFVVFVRTARASSISATRRATPRCGPSRRSANRSPSTASRKSPRALPPDGPICHRSRNSGRGEILRAGSSSVAAIGGEVARELIEHASIQTISERIEADMRGKRGR